MTPITDQVHVCPIAHAITKWLNEHPKLIVQYKQDGHSEDSCRLTCELDISGRLVVLLVEFLGDNIELMAFIYNKGQQSRHVDKLDLACPAIYHYSDPDCLDSILASIQKLPRRLRLAVKKHPN